MTPHTHYSNIELFSAKVSSFIPHANSATECWCSNDALYFTRQTFKPAEEIIRAVKDRLIMSFYLAAHGLLDHDS